MPLLPFLFEEVNGDVVQFDVIGGLAIGFFGAPGHEVLGLGKGLGAGVLVVVAHGYLLLEVLDKSIGEVNFPF